VTAKTAARPSRAARRPSGAASCTRFAGDEAAAAACGTAAAGLSPTTLEFTPAIIGALELLDLVSCRAGLVGLQQGE
jgi:hypothetical protein